MISVNQSFTFECKCCFYFCTLTCHLYLTSLTFYVIATYFQNNETYDSVLLYSSYMLSSSQVRFKIKNPLQTKRYGSTLINIQKVNNLVLIRASTLFQGAIASLLFKAQM